MNIVAAESAEQLRQVRQLFQEYAESLSFQLCFQNFQQELDGLPGDYAPPSGRLWLVLTERGEAVGCVALRRLESGIGEMKRLYVRPGHRGSGWGKRLTQLVIDEAANIGYERIRLDTTPAMTEAIQLYESLGFQRIAPYRANPIEGALYMEMKLNCRSPIDPVRIAADQADLIAPLFDAYRQFYGQASDLEAARRFLMERLTRGDSVIFAVVDQERARGFTQLYPSFSSVSMKPIWILNDLFVAEEARGQGIGAALLRAAREHAARTGAVRLALATAVTNTTAQALYERDGWRKDTAFFHYEFELPREGC